MLGRVLSLTLSLLLTGWLIVASRTTLTLETATATSTVTATVSSIETAALGILRLHALNLSRSRVGDRTGDGIRGVVDIEALIDGLRNRLDLSSELLLDAVEVESVLPIDQVDSQTEVTETTRTTDTMEICLGILGEVKVDDDVDGLNIDTTGQQVGADKISAVTSAEVVEDAVTILLQHTSVRVETRVA